MPPPTSIRSLGIGSRHPRRFTRGLRRVIWFTERCLNNALRLEEYAGDAERDGDKDLAEFFKRAQDASRRGAEQGKDLLSKRLAS